MGSQKDPSETGDPEDLPSDFFDDFTKDEFMQGLSVIDSWDDDETGKRRIDAEALDNVKDLRELIRSEGKDDNRYNKNRGNFVNFNSKYKWQKGSDSDKRRSGSRSKLDEFIKPGSRRDPNKTNEAIKKDKEVKVKELLAKHLDDDLRPPGTELDDYYSDRKPAERRRSPVIMEEPLPRRRSREYQHRNKVSPLRIRRSPRYSPRRSPRREFIRRSPYRHFRQISPQRKFRRYSPQRHSPQWRSQQWRSPRRSSPMRRSPRRISPMRRRNSPLLRSPCRLRNSRSPLQNQYSERHSQSPAPYRDTFLYPNDPSFPQAGIPYSNGPYPGPSECPEGPPGYSYPQGPSFAAGYGPPGYEYGVQPQISSIPMPVPAPAQVVTPLPIAPTSVPPLITIAPTMVPPPSQTISPSPNTSSVPDTLRQQHDALAQLVADGKLSQQDYLKLAPNKGVSNSLDTKTRVDVLNRCNQALTKLSKLLLPNRLSIHHSITGIEPKCLAPKYCSPLKRQAAVEFQFTKVSGAAVQNKQLVDSIIATIGLDKIVTRPKKKAVKDMKDVAVQTTKPYCDVCEIRESTRFYDSSTYIDPEHFCSSRQTQVVEQDLFNSKSVFNPTGSAMDSAPISISHMTPAQLVSQLAARAKTLKQSDPSAPSDNQWRNPPNYGNRGGHYSNYDNYSNYRY